MALGLVVAVLTIIWRRPRRPELMPVLWTGGVAFVVSLVADAASGSGLRGLADGVGALDGRISLDSPPGDGTRLRAQIPRGNDEDRSSERPSV